MHDAKAIVSAPCSISIFARNMDFLPGHPPQVMNPITSISSSQPSKTPLRLFTALKHPLPGQKSSVCWHLIIPNFIFLSLIL